MTAKEKTQQDEKLVLMICQQYLPFELVDTPRFKEYSMVTNSLAELVPNHPNVHSINRSYFFLSDILGTESTL